MKIVIRAGAGKQSGGAARKAAMHRIVGRWLYFKTDQPEICEMPSIRRTTSAARCCALFRLAALLLLFGFAASSLAQTPVTLQLKWRHGFQFAG